MSWTVSAYSDAVRANGQYKPHVACTIFAPRRDLQISKDIRQLTFDPEEGRGKRERKGGKERPCNRQFLGPLCTFLSFITFYTAMLVAHVGGRWEGNAISPPWSACGKCIYIGSKDWRLCSGRGTRSMFCSRTYQTNQAHSTVWGELVPNKISV